MSFLSNKSEFNLEAAKILIENNLYAPSVHCSYYSVFQKLKYKYISKKNLSYDDLNQNIGSNTKSTHTYIVDEFCDFFVKDKYKKEN